MASTLVSWAPTQRLQNTCKGLRLALFLLLVLPALASAQSDPLSTSNMPAIDTNPADYPSNIWVTDTMQKVRQDAGSPGSLHWGTFYGTQNEFVDFQIHWHDTGKGTTGLNITISNFVQTAPKSFTIPASNAIVYREAYIDVATQVTSTANTFYNTLGYYPDVLIPTVDPYHGQTTNAFPFTVAANQNQSTWVDIHIPSNAPAGYYTGTVTVQTGCPGSCSTVATLPIILAVWQWPSSGSMPSTSSLASFTSTGYSAMCNQAYGSYYACGAYPGSGGSSDQAITLMMVDFLTTLLDHRYSGTGLFYPIYTTAFTGLETYYAPLFNGTAKTILPGAKLTTAEYDPNPLTYVQNWMTEFQSKGWLPQTLFKYTCDEPPNGCAWADINTIAATLHASAPPMRSLVTTNLSRATTNGVLNGIDIMVPIINDLDPIGGSLQRSAYNSWLSGTATPSGPTRLLWSYQSCESSGTCSNGTVGGTRGTWPSYNIDNTPVATRVMEWLSYRNGVSGELYYGATTCWEGTSCTNGSSAGSDPWKYEYSFGGWGNGTLLYPGVASKLGAGVTTPFWVPSMRLKYIRDGMQDYEYLNALNSAGQGSVVTTQINSWITSSSSFETTGAGLQNARTALGAALHQLTYSGTLSPPTGLTATVH